MHTPTSKYNSRAKLSLLIIGVLVLFAAPQFLNLKFDYDFEKFFPKGDQELEFYLQHRDRFETDNDFFLIGIEGKNGVFNQAFLKQISALSDSLSNLSDVRFVNSPTNVFNPVITPFGIAKVPYLQLDSVKNYKRDSINIYRTPALIGTIFSKDAKTICINVKTEQHLSKKRCDNLTRNVENTIAHFGFNDAHIAGKIHGQYYYIQRMQSEAILFTTISLVLLVLFLFVSFRSFWGVWVPIIVVLVTVALLLSLILFFSHSLSILTMLLPSILFVVGIADSVHVIEKYLEELRYGNDKLTALRNTYRETGAAIFLTMLTTSVGFLSLLTSGIIPIREFGIFAAIGVFIAFCLSFTLLPAILWLKAKPKVAQVKIHELFWTKRLHTLLMWVLKQHRIIAAASLMIFLVSVYGISKIIINNYLLEDLAETDKVKRDFVFFEDHFSGVRPFEMAVNIVDSNNSFKNPKVWQEIDKLEIYLKDSYGLGFIVSPITFIKSLNKALHNGDQYYYMLPNDSLSLQKVNTYIKKTANNKELKSYVSNDFKVGRLSARQTDLGGRIIAQKNKDLAHYVATNIDSNLIKVQVTGMAHLIDKNNADLASDMLIGLFIDFIVIGFIFFWLYRSFKVTLIAILVNMLPLLVIGGIMGFSGIHLKVSTSIIFSIAIGIAVDDTVHILSKLRLELLKGKSLLYALKHTYLHTGKAVVVTTLILSSGFFTLVLSDFASIFYMGLLITITLVCAILSDLLLLPVLCIYWLKKEDLTFMKKKI